MEKWSSSRVFIIATIGSAVGLGNIWRFSAIAGLNGGGAYLLPFILAVIFLAFPLMVVEMAVGRHLEKDVVSSFRSLRERYAWVGWFIFLVMVMITGVYLVITGWTLAFLVSSTGAMDLSFPDLTAGYLPVLFFLVTLAITSLIVSKGVRSGIERMSNALVPLTFVILAILLVYSVQTTGFMQGLEYLFTPDFSKMSEAGLWTAAFGQAFFSLSVGYGLIITYSSYMGKDVNITRSAIAVCIADVSVAIIAGTIIFAVVFTNGLEPTVGAELAFVTLPAAFDGMPLGELLAFLFFALLFTAALTSSVSMMEVNVASVMNNLSLDRARSSLLVGGLVTVVGMAAALSYSALDLRIMGERVLDILDHAFGTVGILLAALLTALMFSWYVDRQFLEDEISCGCRRFVLPLVKYIVPVVLATVLLFTLLPI